MAGSSSGSSSSQGQSSSSSFIPSYSESPILSAIAQYAYGLGGQTYNQAQQAYANLGSITNANMANYLQTSQDALHNAENAQSEYQNVFQPEENQLVQDANSYASQARIAQEMGRAEASAGQSADAARRNSEQNLMSYGIDPSSGRYAGLDRADELSRASMQAAAGQAARYNTEATGRQLRADAIQVGETLPGQITASQNTALQGIAGAENSELASANTGIALQNAANPYLQTGMSLKYPPLGNQSQSTNSSNSVNSSQSSDPQQNSNGGNGGQQGSGSGGGGGGYGGGSGGGGSSATPGDYQQVDSTGDYGGIPSDYYNGGDFGGGIGYGGNSSDLGYDNPFYDPYGASGSLGDNTGSDSSSTYGDPSGQFYDPYSAYPSGDSGVGGSDIPSSGGDTYATADYSDYAEGGLVLGPYQNRPIPRAQRQMSARSYDFKGGGHVHPGMSPSRGKQVDDVRADLNVGEEVIPRDVVIHKGREFFAKLIAQTRKNAATLAARPHGHGMRK